MAREQLMEQLAEDNGGVVVVGFYRDKTTPVSASDSRLLVRAPCAAEPEYIFVKSMNEQAIGGTIAMGQSFKFSEIDMCSPGSEYRYIIRGSPDNDVQHDINHIKKLWHERDIGTWRLGL